MNKLRRIIPYFCLIVWDALSAIFSLYITVSQRFPKGVGTTAFTVLSTYYPFIVVIFIAVSLLLGCYSTVLRHIGFRDAVRQFIAVTISGFGVYILDITGIVDFFHIDVHNYSYDIGIYLV